MQHKQLQALFKRSRSRSHCDTPTATSRMLPTRQQSEFESGMSKMLLVIAYLNLTLISIIAIRNAYQNGDVWMAGFIIFVNFGYFYTNYCVQEFNRLPPGDESLWKRFLKLNLWVIPSAILFGFAYQYGTFINPILALVPYGVATASSALLFYVYIISADDNKSSAKINKVILEMV